VDDTINDNRRTVDLEQNAVVADTQPELVRVVGESFDIAGKISRQCLEVFSCTWLEGQGVLYGALSSRVSCSELNMRGAAKSRLHSSFRLCALRRDRTARPGDLILHASGAQREELRGFETEVSEDNCVAQTEFGNEGQRKAEG
jgi:hypothetical protein